MTKDKEYAAQEDNKIFMGYGKVVAHLMFAAFLCSKNEIAGISYFIFLFAMYGVILPREKAVAFFEVLSAVAISIAGLITVLVVLFALL